MMKKWNRNDAVMELRSINTCLMALLPLLIRANLQTIDQVNLAYNTHIKLSLLFALMAALHIFVLSIIPHF
jgi:hypothetical protein